ncbi:HAMP domain-containing histidine kinase [Fictibacillus sp. Mic-4]|uniref:sensor histidine kinase n=1 Tax=Fictibacillus TaxID=1329200 RepID=UPI00040143CE|nr:HAMP domain-containing histidine kinase [Fictibacillus gelatini]
MKKRQVMKRFLLGILIFMSANAILTFIAYYVTSKFYGLIGKHPHGVWEQLITVLVVFLLFSCGLFFFSFIGRRRQWGVWDTIVDALRRMAKGDFSVKLDIQSNEQDPLGKLVKGINEMAEELGEMEKMRQEFISNVSHEIQSPLTSINGFARALKNVNLTDEERLRYLTIIEMESGRLSKISDNLLKLTSLESNHHPFEPVEYRLDKQLRSVVLASEPAWLEKEIEMNVELDKLTVIADQDLMNQVWTNVLHNSIKFTPAGGAIGVKAKIQGDQAVISITDTGIGMTEEDQKHIFERFYKADPSRTSSKGGSGLGLSIVKKIVEMHHGTISVQSSPGKGTVFSITIPAGVKKV